MARFKSIPAKITMKSLTSHEADKVMRESKLVRESLPDKYFISHNQHKIKAIEADIKENKRSDN